MYVSPRPSWFTLGAMSALSHVAFFWFHFKKRNETKKKKKTEKKKKENYKKNQVMKMSKMKTKSKQNEQN